MRRSLLLFTTGLALCLPPLAGAAARPEIAALQVGLRQHGLYSGTIDGLFGPTSARAVETLQTRAGITVDGLPGPKTRRALGSYGRFDLGDRAIARGASGWDVAALQFLLASQGFPSGEIDGSFGARTSDALRRFQTASGLEADGVAGPRTLEVLRAPPPRAPLVLAWPLRYPVSGGFGPRDSRFHAGLDIAGPSGAPIDAAAGGRVVHAGWLDGGWGNAVIIEHAGRVRTLYAHLSVVEARAGTTIAEGAMIGHVGATGRSSGPHLHFEVRVGDAAVDPLTVLPGPAALHEH